MEYIVTKDFTLHRTAVTIGKFDGIHIGHRCLIDRVLAQKSRGLAPAMLTFRIQNGRLFPAGGKDSKFIHTEEERVEYLGNTGLEYMISYPFSKETAALSPEEFVREILVGQMGTGYIAVGSDFCFGRDRTGNAGVLKELSEGYGFEVCVVDKLAYGGETVSSSKVRQAISGGDMEYASVLLGRPFSVMGEVVYGNQIGRELGMPTANLRPGPDKLLPPNGVYASKVRVGDRVYMGVTNIGYKPTVGGETMPGVETYLFAYSGNLYGRKIEVGLYRYLRGEQKFESLEALKQQMQADMEDSWL